jgi:hypothetical protein
LAGDEEGDSTRQQLLRQRVKIGQEAVGGGRRQVDRLAACPYRAGRIGGVERIGDQHRGCTASAFGPAGRRHRCQEQALAGAVQHHDLVHRIDRPRQFESPAEPLRRRLAEVVEPFVHGIAAELVDMGGNHRTDEGGNAVPGFANRKADGRFSRRAVAQELAQPHERRAADIGARGGGLGRVSGQRWGDAFGGGHVHRLSGARPPRNGFLNPRAARLRRV